MADWTTVFETTPADTNNPGYGAEAIRGLKTEIRTRMEVEHSYGPDENDVANGPGVHLEGSGRVFVNDDKVSGNTDADRTSLGSRIVAPTGGTVNDVIGRLVVDLNELDSAPERNGETDDVLITDAMKNISTIECYDASGTLVTVIDPATFMSTVIDQTIRGVKTYIDVQLAQGQTSNTDYDGTDDQPNELVVRSDEVQHYDLALNSSPYDPGDYDFDLAPDTFNNNFTTGYSWPVSWGADWTGAKRSNKNITVNRLWAETIRAANLYGATYA